MTALALVESPVQLLHVIEWCHATASAERTTVAVLAPVDETSRGQLRSMLEYAAEEGIEACWYEPRRSSGALLGTLIGLRRQMVAAEQLVIGDPFSGMVQLLLPGTRAGELVLVDDGTATIEFVARLAVQAPLTRWDAPERTLAARLRHPIATAATRRFTPSIARPVTVFTVMPAARIPGLSVRENRYDWTRRRFGRPQVVAGTDIVGTSLVESGVVEAPAYLDAVASLAGGARGGRYYAHRREEDAKLATIAQRTGLTVVRPEVPLEVELRRGPVAEQVVSFPSSVGYTLPVILASVPCRVRLVPVDPSWLLAGVGTRARTFLTTIVANQAGVTAA